MNKKTISPNPQRPVDRVPTGQLPNILAELSEEALDTQALPGNLYDTFCGPSYCGCSYDGDDE